MKVVIIMGSTSDEPHAKKITDNLDGYGIDWEQHAASAHKEPLKDDKRGLGILQSKSFRAFFFWTKEGSREWNDIGRHQI